MASSENPEQPSRRLRQFLKTIDKALSEARKSMDTQAAVEECYSDDAAIFAGISGDDTIAMNEKRGKKRSRDEEEKEAKKMLADLIEGMMDSVNHQVRREVEALIQKEGLNSKFATIEKISHILQKKDIQKKAEEAEDRQKTKEALHKLLKLPDGCSPMHVINYHAYRVKLEQKEALLAEIQKVNDETKDIESQIKERKENIFQGVQNIEQVRDTITNTADICSLRTE